MALAGLPMQMTLSTGNAAGRIAGVFGRLDRRTRAAVRDVVQDAAGREFQRASDLCPKDTHFMVEHLRLRFTRGRFGYELGWDEADFEAAGLAFYPVYQEFGTSKMAAQPCLFPARNEIRPLFQANLSRVLRQAIQRRGAGA
ncbi:MAG TPA: hypothetical protein VFS11_05825 [Gemmatimonadales bacterium]|nr:hypothetical protein [Gemmatimonadales bacterium]